MACFSFLFVCMVQNEREEEVGAIPSVVWLRRSQTSGDLTSATTLPIPNTEVSDIFIPPSAVLRRASDTIQDCGIQYWKISVFLFCTKLLKVLLNAPRPTKLHLTYGSVILSLPCHQPR